MEGLVAKVWKGILGVEVVPEGGFRVMKYREAMERFGSDKPDLRFGLEVSIYWISRSGAGEVRTDFGLSSYRSNLPILICPLLLAHA